MCVLADGGAFVREQDAYKHHGRTPVQNAERDRERYCLLVGGRCQLLRPQTPRPGASHASSPNESSVFFCFFAFFFSLSADGVAVVVEASSPTALRLGGFFAPPKETPARFAAGVLDAGAAGVSAFVSAENAGSSGSGERPLAGMRR
jgi:hypothetical protein